MDHGPINKLTGDNLKNFHKWAELGAKNGRPVVADESVAVFQQNRRITVNVSLSALLGPDLSELFDASGRANSSSRPIGQ